jgi:DNA polymerase elongation subunit (family B)
VLCCTVRTLLEERREEKRREEKREEQEQVRNTYTYIFVVVAQKLKINVTTVRLS